MSEPVERSVHAILAPSRGLVPLQNRSGRRYALLDVLRWLHYSHLVFKTDKIDLLADHASIGHIRSLFEAFRETPTSETLRLAVRVSADVTPESIAAIPPDWIWDVMITASPSSARNLGPWLDWVEQSGLDARVQVNFPGDWAPEAREAVMQAVAHAAAKAIFVYCNDPFERAMWRTGAAGDPAVLTELARDLRGTGKPLSIVGVPFCMVERDHWPYVRDHDQFFLDPQHYVRDAYTMALRLHRKRPTAVGKIIQLRLKQGVTYDAPLERRLLAWLYTNHPVAYGRVMVLRTLFRLAGSTRIIPYEDENPAAAKTDDAFAQGTGNDAACDACALQRICDRRTDRVAEAFPAFHVRPIEGDVVHDPLQYADLTTGYLDALDLERCVTPAHLEHLASVAGHLVSNVPPSKVLQAELYQAENTYSKPLPGAVRWFSIRSGEKVSREFDDAQTPYTVAVTFGGGMADLIGFALADHVRVLCPMVAPSHRLVLHVDREGAYVLLRDGIPVRPVDVPGEIYAPRKLPTRVRPRLSMWNVEGSMFTQNLAIWTSTDAEGRATGAPDFSVVIVCARFSRRLQATLRCLAHQDYDLSKVEIVVAYVPGADPTDDILASMERTFPDVAIVRSPLPERYLRTKGVAINQSLELARGSWHLVLDADTLLPPDFFRRVRDTEGSPSFVGPDRRKMLPPDVTAAILMGEVNPWDAWESLLHGPGEMRVREGGHLPVGYCQCVRAECTARVRYRELDHFEGADWDFITDVERTCGPGIVFEDYAVLHLDHGGSQWYGAVQHL